MKRTITMFSLAMLLGVVPVAALAHGTKLSMTKEAINAALDKFSKEETASVNGFVGVKGWPDGHNIMVKIYLGNNTTVQYTCMEHEMENAEMWMCEKSQ
jgi:hypothetical protein